MWLVRFLHDAGGVRRGVLGGYSILPEILAVRSGEGQDLQAEKVPGQHSLVLIAHEDMSLAPRPPPWPLRPDSAATVLPRGTGDAAPGSARPGPGAGHAWGALPHP